MSTLTESPAVDPTWLLEKAVRDLCLGDYTSDAVWPVLAAGAARALDDLEAAEAALHEQVRREGERVRGLLEAAAALVGRDPGSLSGAEKDALREAGAHLLPDRLLPTLV